MHRSMAAADDLNKNALQSTRNTKMGYLGATSYVIGNIIGSGIFITPSSILRQTNSIGLSLIVWVLCALIAILGIELFSRNTSIIRRSYNPDSYFLKTMNLLFLQVHSAISSWRRAFANRAVILPIYAM